MIVRKLIPLIGALLITGGGVYAMVSGYQAWQTTANSTATAGGLSVVTLPTVEVVATPLPAHAPRQAQTGGEDDASYSADLHKTTLRLTLPQLRMPYYSFGSATLQIGKD